jgi:hypothetical protein
VYEPCSSDASTLAFAASTCALLARTCASAVAICACAALALARAASRLMRHGVGIDGLVAFEILHGLRQIGFGLARAGVGFGRVRSLHADLCLRLLVLAFRCRELSAYLREPRIVVARVDVEQRIAGIDVLVVVDVELDHAPRDLRGNLTRMAVDECVVGRLVTLRMAPEDDRDDDQDEDDGQDDGHQHRPLVERLLVLAVALAVVALLVVAVLPLGIAVLAVALLLFLVVLALAIRFTEAVAESFAIPEAIRLWRVLARGFGGELVHGRVER